MHRQKRRISFLGARNDSFHFSAPKNVWLMHFYDIKAMRQYAGVINLLGHPCSNYFEHVDIEAVVKEANRLGIPLRIELF